MAGLPQPRGFIPALVSLCLALACATSPEPESDALVSDGIQVPVSRRAVPPALVILVSVAGLTPDHYLPAQDPPMPGLAALARAGVAAERVKPVAPGAPYPVHTTLVTGVLPSRHGVPADQLMGERGVRRERYWHASRVSVPTLWQQVESGRGRVLALDWPATVGAEISLLLPDLEPTRRGEQWLDLLANESSPALLELARAAPLPVLAGPGTDRDAFLVTAACQAVRSGSPPRLTLVRLRQSGLALRRYGPRAPEALAAFARVDDEIARLTRCLGEAGRLEGTALVVLGDRALLPVHTSLRPNVILSRAGLILPGRGSEPPSWRALARSNGGSAFVYAREGEDAVEARRVLRDEGERSGAFRIVSAEEMIERGADPEAWFGLDAEPGFVFDDAASGPPLAPAAVRGSGGYLADRPDLSPGFVAVGRGLRSRLLVPEMSQLDVAPTLARLLRVELPEATGHAFLGWLRLGPDVASGAPALPGAQP